MRRLWTVLALAALVAVAGCSHKGHKPVAGKETTIDRGVLAHGGTDTLRLGRIRYGEIVERRFSIRNATGRPLVILSHQSTCACTEIEYERKPIAPSDVLPVVCRFDSTGEYGDKLTVVSLNLSETEQKLELLVMCEIE